MSDLTEFLLTRIAEDEQEARAVRRGPEWFIADQPPTRWGEDARPDELLGSGKPLATFTDYDRMAIFHIIRHDPARVLAECDAKRRIIDLHGGMHDDGQTFPHECPDEVVRSPKYGVIEIHVGYERECLTLRLLASPFADHPDYRDEWRP